MNKFKKIIVGVVLFVFGVLGVVGTNGFFNKSYAASNEEGFYELGDLYTSPGSSSYSLDFSTFNKLIQVLGEDMEATLPQVVSKMNEKVDNGETGVKQNVINSEEIRNVVLTDGERVVKEENQNLKIKINGISFHVVYISTSSSGDVIATLWMDSNMQSGFPSATNINTYIGTYKYGLYSKFANNYETTGNPTSVTYPAAMYARSYVRAAISTMTGTKNYGTGDTTTATMSVLGSNPFYSNIYNRGNIYNSYNTGSVASYNYIVTPSSVDWQKTLEGSKQGLPYNSSNDAYATNISTGFKSDNENGYVYNYETKSYYTEWNGDYFWLPSLAEVGSSDSTGLWHTSKLQRANTKTYDGFSVGENGEILNADGSSLNVALGSSFTGTIYDNTLLRSSAYSNGGVMALNYDGEGYKEVSTRDTLAIRPCIHINLSAISRTERWLTTEKRYDEVAISGATVYFRDKGETYQTNASYNLQVAYYNLPQLAGMLKKNGVLNFYSVMYIVTDSYVDLNYPITFKRGMTTTVEEDGYLLGEFTSGNMMQFYLNNSSYTPKLKLKDVSLVGTGNLTTAVNAFVIGVVFGNDHYSGNVEMTGGEITGNNTTVFKGYNSSASAYSVYNCLKITLNDVYVHDNLGYAGGVISIYTMTTSAARTSYVTLNNCIFENNGARKVNAGITSRSETTFDNANIMNGAGGGGGGVIWAYANISGVLSNFTFTNCVFRNNKGFEGGVLYVYNMTNLFVHNCLFEGNSSILNNEEDGTKYYSNSSNLTQDCGGVFYLVDVTYFSSQGSEYKNNTSNGEIIRFYGNANKQIYFRFNTYTGTGRDGDRVENKKNNFSSNTANKIFYVYNNTYNSIGVSTSNFNSTEFVENKYNEQLVYLRNFTCKGALTFNGDLFQENEFTGTTFDNGIISNDDGTGALICIYPSSWYNIEGMSFVGNSFVGNSCASAVYVTGYYSTSLTNFVEFTSNTFEENNFKASLVRFYINGPINNKGVKFDGVTFKNNNGGGEEESNFKNLISVYLTSTWGNISFNDITFEGNLALNRGIRFYGTGGSTSSNVRFTNITFGKEDDEIRQTFKNAIYCDDRSSIGTFEFNNCKFYNLDVSGPNCLTVFGVAGATNLILGNILYSGVDGNNTGRLFEMYSVTPTNTLATTGRVSVNKFAFGKIEMTNNINLKRGFYLVGTLSGTATDDFVISGNEDDYAASSLAKTTFGSTEEREGSFGIVASGNIIDGTVAEGESSTDEGYLVNVDVIGNFANYKFNSNTFTDNQSTKSLVRVRMVKDSSRYGFNNYEYNGNTFTGNNCGENELFDTSDNDSNGQERRKNIKIEDNHLENNEAKSGMDFNWTVPVYYTSTQKVTISLNAGSGTYHRQMTASNYIIKSGGSGVGSTYSVAKVSFSGFTANSSVTVKYLYNNTSRSAYDYALFSTLDCTASNFITTSTGVPSSSYYVLSTYNSTSASWRSLTYTLPNSSEHYFYVKYRHNSANYATSYDYVQFYISSITNSCYTTNDYTISGTTVSATYTPPTFNPNSFKNNEFIGNTFTDFASSLIVNNIKSDIDISSNIYRENTITSDTGFVAKYNLTGYSTKTIIGAYTFENNNSKGNILNFTINTTNSDNIILTDFKFINNNTGQAVLDEEENVLSKDVAVFDVTLTGNFGFEGLEASGNKSSENIINLKNIKFNNTSNSNNIILHNITLENNSAKMSVLSLKSTTNTKVIDIEGLAFNSNIGENAEDSVGVNISSSFSQDVKMKDFEIIQNEFYKVFSFRNEANASGGYEIGEINFLENTFYKTGLELNFSTNSQLVFEGTKVNDNKYLGTSDGRLVDFQFRSFKSLTFTSKMVDEVEEKFEMTGNIGNDEGNLTLFYLSGGVSVSGASGEEYFVEISNFDISRNTKFDSIMDFNLSGVPKVSVTNGEMVGNEFKNGIVKVSTGSNISSDMYFVINEVDFYSNAFIGEEEDGGIIVTDILKQENGKFNLEKVNFGEESRGNTAKWMIKFLDLPNTATSGEVDIKDINIRYNDFSVGVFDLSLAGEIDYLELIKFSFVGDSGETEETFGEISHNTNLSNGIKIFVLTGEENPLNFSNNKFDDNNFTGSLVYLKVGGLSLSMPQNEFTGNKGGENGEVLHIISINKINEADFTNMVFVENSGKYGVTIDVQVGEEEIPNADDEEEAGSINIGGTFNTNEFSGYVLKIVTNYLAVNISEESLFNENTITSSDGGVLICTTNIALTLGGQFIQNNSSGYIIKLDGGTVYKDTDLIYNNSVHISGAEISQNTSLNSPLYVLNGRTITVSGVFNENTLTSEVETTRGGALYIYGFNNITIENGEFTNNHSNNGSGGAVYVSSSEGANGLVEILSTTFSENSALNNGGALFIGDNISKVTINGGSFAQNSVTGDNANGGAIHFANDVYGELSVIGTQFNENSATNNGGAIYHLGKGNVTGGTFNENSATNGGGVFYASKTITTLQYKLEETNFYKNSASNCGGAVYGNSLEAISSNFGEEDQGNSAQSKGGTIYVYGNVNLTDCNINYSSSVQGGAIYIEYNSELGLSSVAGGSLANNKGEEIGGAIYSENAVAIRGVAISNNTSNEGIIVGIYTHSHILESEKSNRTIVVSENSSFTSNTVTNGGLIISKMESLFDAPVVSFVEIENVTFSNNTSNTSLLEVLKNNDWSVTGATFNNSNANSIISVGSSEPLTTGEKAPSLKMSSSEFVGDNTQREFIIKVESGSLLLEEVAFGETSVSDSEVYLAKNTTLQIVGGESAGLKEASSQTNGSVLKIEGKATINGFSIKDVYSSMANGGGIYVGSEGNVSLYNTTISNCTAKNGGAVYNLGVLTLSDGNFERNSAVGTGDDGKGGGVYVGNGATFSVTRNNEGKKFVITNGRALFGGGIYLDDSSVVTLNGGEIKNNSANFGGGIYGQTGSTIVLNGGQISDNTILEGGALGAGIATFGNFQMSEGIISNNGHANVTCQGGGIYAGSGAVLSLTGGEISGNFTSKGSAIYINTNVTANLSGIRIENNRDLSGIDGGSIIEVNGDSSLVLDKITLRANTSESQNGCIIVLTGSISEKANLTISGTFSGNRASNNFISGTNAGVINIFDSTFSGNGDRYMDSIAFECEEFSLENTTFSNTRGGVSLVSKIINIDSCEFSGVTSGTNSATVSPLSIKGNEGTVVYIRDSKFLNCVNSSGAGGGIDYQNSSSSSLVFFEGTNEFRGNSATNGGGGGVSFNGNGAVEIRGQFIAQNNTSLYSGGGVCVNSIDGFVIKKGTKIIIFGNKQGESDSNLFLNENITNIYEGALDTESKIGVVNGGATNSGDIVITSAIEGIKLRNIVLDFFVSDNKNFEFVLDSEKNAVVLFELLEAPLDFLVIASDKVYTVKYPDKLANEDGIYKVTRNDIKIVENDKILGANSKELENYDIKFSMTGEEDWEEEIGGFSDIASFVIFYKVFNKLAPENVKNGSFNLSIVKSNIYLVNIPQITVVPNKTLKDAIFSGGLVEDSSNRAVSGTWVFDNVDINKTPNKNEVYHLNFIASNPDLYDNEITNILVSVDVGYSLVFYSNGAFYEDENLLNRLEYDSLNGISKELKIGGTLVFMSSYSVEGIERIDADVIFTRHSNFDEEMIVIQGSDGNRVGELTLNGVIFDGKGSLTGENAKSKAIIKNSGTLTLGSVEIKNYDLESIEDGGLIVNTDSGVLYINGAKIYANKVSGNNCSVIFNDTNATLNLLNCEIFNNTNVGSGSKGGAIYTKGDARLSGGEIYSNSAENGGAVYVTTTGSATLNQGKIRNNYASSTGGGIYVENEGKITLGNTQIYGNSAETQGGIYTQSGSVIDLYTNTPLSQSELNNIEKDNFTIKNEGKGRAKWWVILFSLIVCFVVLNVILVCVTKRRKGKIYAKNVSKTSKK